MRVIGGFQQFGAALWSCYHYDKDHGISGSIRGFQLLGAHPKGTRGRELGQGRGARIWLPMALCVPPIVSQQALIVLHGPPGGAYPGSA